jgi:hypothetical protein
MRIEESGIAAVMIVVATLVVVQDNFLWRDCTGE